MSAIPDRKSAAVMFTDIVKATDNNCPWHKMIIEEWEKNN